jgi:hypothetical protein
MAKDASNDLSYFLLLDEKDKSYLGSIRHWENLKVGFDEGRVWVKDLDYTQMSSVEVQTLPSKKIYTEKEGKLFPVGSLLPEGRLPAVMWTPVGRAFPVSRPSLNHNYFGLNETIEIRLIASEHEQDSQASLCSLEQLGAYLESAPAIRLKPLKWTIFDDRYAIVLGTPLLPVAGTAYWIDGSFLLPAGFQLELQVLNRELEQVIGVEKGDYVLWDRSGNYTVIKATEWEELSLSSFRLTMKNNGI